MTIKYAILGLLSWQPLSGYDIKKLIADSITFYWSGNNNQIYTILVELHKADLVSIEIMGDENTRTKKVYTITEKGSTELREWILSTPQPPELRNTFLIQLGWADQLSDEDLDSLLDKYDEEIQSLLLIQQEKMRRGLQTPKRTPREIYLWEMISTSIIDHYSHELNWVKKTRKGLAGIKSPPI
jgi:PadR family transcriptional regulator AphA